jgi:ferritin-like metal-binding protein YciE
MDVRPSALLAADRESSIRQKRWIVEHIPLVPPDRARSRLCSEHGLKDLYGAEQKLVKALGKMAKDVGHRELSRGFAAHQKTTQRQVRRLEQVFKKVGKNPRKHPCAGIDDLIREYSTFVREERPGEAVLNVFATEAALKVEHYEIIAYKGLIDLANQIGSRDAVQLLTETLTEE